MITQNAYRVATSLAFKALPLFTVLTGVFSGDLMAQAQNKPTISVPEFKNDTNMNWWWWSGNTSRELADALSNELTSTGNFQLVERQNLGSVLSEQELAELGLTRPETSAQKGQLTGAQYIILGRVTAYEEGVSEESGGNNFGINLGLFSVGNNERQAKQEAYVAIDLRVVDSTTGEVVYARTVEGRATDTESSSANNVRILGIINTGKDSQSASRAPVGKALRAGLIEITDYLSCVMVEQDGCIREYENKEKSRREKTKDILNLD